ncbi:hypothetical protein GCM10027515_13040 [Schumannella luteola]|uniref:Asparagine synthase n=1 Tax=Schumannella luteola TaxID=472059 RepID=A0A852Y956_9MICO|nr:hypothetical protein [Schumannella luteola]NYG97751.1 hypothetical protein [Schumannella luteola]TPX01386.1 hypothetical protein FJ656_27465 [Schumannella luteola]
MRLFRRRRVDVGRYEPLEPTAPAPVERVVDEGVLIAETAVRMSVKNAVILSALRDRLDLDRDSLARHAADELRAAASRELESLERVQRLAEERKDQPKPKYVGDDANLPREPIDAIAERVRPVLAARLRALADDPEHLGDLVERARTEAWAEIAQSFERRAAALARADQQQGDDYELRRADRLAAFLELDLGPGLDAAGE